VSSNDLSKGMESFSAHENGMCIKSHKYYHAQNENEWIAKALDGTDSSDIPESIYTHCHTGTIPAWDLEIMGSETSQS
jgi:hypothetical protein